jgi:hypothetical protein
MRILQNPYRRDILLIALAALVVRLVAIPWAHTVQADAVSRIHIAYEWLLDPYYIKEGYWGPLHHYLNALFMLVLPGKTAGPLALNILCASLTAIPIYGFTLNLFNSRRGAVFAALFYVFSPIILWTSMQALSEVSYGFFLAMALFAISEGSREGMRIKSAIAAGLLITCAAALRYEAWVIIAALTLVHFLLRGWRTTLIFWGCAMLFPATWMIGNQLAYGDFLYSVNQNDVWNMLKEGINDEVLPEDGLKRGLFFPWSFMLNVSPLGLALLLAGLVIAALRRRLNREQWIWLIPMTVMVFVFEQKAIEGSLMMQHRFLVTWLVLLLPFIALVFDGTRWMGARTVLLSLAFVSVIPFTFAWNKVDYVKVFGEGNFGKAMDDLVIAYYRELEVIPRLPDKETKKVLDVINAQSSPGAGLILDFHGWDRSYYILLHAEANTMVVGGAKHETYAADKVAELLREHPFGQLLFTRTGMLQEKVSLKGNTMVIEGVDAPLVVEGPIVLRGLRLYKYRVAANDDPAVLASAEMEPRSLFPAEKDPEFFQQTIRTNEEWFNKIQRQAYQESVPVDTMVQRHVDYLLKMEAGE